MLETLARPPTRERPALRYHGGKFMIAPWILEHAPDHEAYTEAFSGAASVLLRKPRSFIEVINDRDEDLVNFFRVLRDPEGAAELERQLRLTPYARREFERAYEPAEDPVERARRLVVRSFMGFGSAAANPEHMTGFRPSSPNRTSTPAWDFARYPDALPSYCRRLQGVLIECWDAADVLRDYDGRDTLHYVDPPYPQSTRGFRLRNHAYRYEMDDDGHRALADVLKSLKGYVVLSGYACPLYDEELFPEWFRVERRALADGGRERIEVLWLNNRAREALEGRVRQRDLF